MTGGSPPEPPHRERRIEKARYTVELILDTFFRPGDWAARITHRAGLQGKLRTTTTVIQPSGKLRREAPLRIAFASDFHAGSTTGDDLLSEACRLLDALEPDVLLLGGDFVSVRASDIRRLAPELARINAPYGKFGVPGNHDLRANYREVEAALRDAGVTVLRNGRQTLAKPFDDITICGLDDMTRGTPRADLAMDGVDGTRVVLMHSPDGLEAIGDRTFDLALCGHTHGGQLVLPWGVPLWVPGDGLNRTYCHGRFGVGADEASTLIVSRGVGCSTLPLRTFAAPEVHLCLIV
jgi:predicted MPP superfamily phosphohydrolase